MRIILTVVIFHLLVNIETINGKIMEQETLNLNNQVQPVTLNQTISSHVLDLNSGKPSEGIKAELFIYQPDSKEWLPVGNGVTNKDGRIQNMLNEKAVQKGLYKIVFFTGEYFEKKGLDAFYPEIDVKFQIKDPTQKYHIPLLLNQFGFSTYRGS
jgi:5-hydroxyisourate hydrolase